MRTIRKIYKKIKGWFCKKGPENHDWYNDGFNFVGKDYD